MASIHSTLSSNTLRFALSSFPKTNLQPPSSHIFFSRPLTFKGLTINPKSFPAPLKASMAGTNNVVIEVFEQEDLAVSLAKYVPIPPSNVHAINDTLSAEGAADDYETCLRELVNSSVITLSPSSGFPKFDLVLLGMGPDGHVASLFPGHPLVQENKRWVAFIKDSPKPPPERITFTFPVINASAYAALVVTGKGKADAVHSVLGKSQNSVKLPAGLVSPEEELKWFLDKDAASKL
ncbi:hypothetical protein V8G54_007805 [Vigna mungo]|uniref:Probable 6-phosphogluconolactonase n=1 Tax=Vigna mungo TaxID=3915 RepID=A0AAQ3P638_VIGMU